MLQPPTIVSTKDLLYLKDILTWQLLTLKQLHHYGREMKMPALKQLSGQLIEMHRQHAQTILGHLKTDNAKGVQDFQARLQAMPAQPAGAQAMATRS
ncbi:MAG: hypothetical protein IMX05_07705 [Hydrogenibacillus schlegelii]|nr:hypothetical protein [Hydrogenibacillus schlegelii]